MKYLMLASALAVAIVSSGPSFAAAEEQAAAPTKAAAVREPTVSPPMATTDAVTCVCPYDIFDYGPQDDGVFGARISYTTLSVGTPGVFVVKIGGPELTTNGLNNVEVFFDVNKFNAGPEYSFDYYPGADRDGVNGQYVSRLDTWNSYGRDVACPKWQTFVNYRTDIITMSIPRICMGSPAKVRWSPVTWHFTKYYADGGFYGYYDGIPYYHRFANFWTGKTNPPPCTC